MSPSNQVRHGHVCTNPVWSLQQLGNQLSSPGDPVDSQLRLLVMAREWQESGIRFHTSAPFEKLFYLHSQTGWPPREELSPGVVGLVVDRAKKTGFVSPLKVMRSTRWSVAHTLPFRVGHVQDALMRLLQASERPLDDLVPEVLAFSFAEALGERSEGASMDVAALLAIVDLMNDSPDLLRCACAVVQPAREGQLESVDSTQIKLKAFQREYGRGSLLVRSKLDSSDFDFLFDEVWPTDDFRELANYLEKKGLLKALLQAHPLTTTEVVAAKERLRWLTEDQRYQEALQFASRIQKCGAADSVPVRLYVQIEEEIEHLYRHLGRYQEAIASSARVVDRLTESGDLACFQDCLDAEVRLAAAYYDAHDFQQMVRLLEPWQNRLLDTPQIVTPESRAFFLNTLARAMIILEKPGWETLLRESLELQERIDRGNLARTRNYLIHGLLRNMMLTEAEREMNEMEGSGPAASLSTAFLQFYKAELARQRKELWPGPGSEDDLTEGRGHAYAFFLQATARQKGRSAEDAARRFGLAAEEFLRDVDPNDELNVQLFLAAAMKLGEAGASADDELWESSRNKLKHYLRQCYMSSFDDYYRDTVGAITPTPSPGSANRLLIKIPFF